MKGVWSNSVRVGKEIEKIGVNFTESFSKELGDGRKTSFWNEKWATSGRLKDEFPRLYQLETNKNATVSGRGVWVGDSWEWRWDWGRPPRGRALGELETLRSVLQFKSPNRGKKDNARWELDPINGFSTKILRSILEEKREVGGEVMATDWIKAVPRKVCVFWWRVRRGRIPTRGVLDNLGVDLDSKLCPRCGNDEESVVHALVSCVEVRKIWDLVGKWWNLEIGMVNSVYDPLQVHGGSSDKSRAAAIWTATVLGLIYLIWTHRNEIVLKNDQSKLVDKFIILQRRLFEWIKNREPSLIADWNCWLMNPGCIGPGR